MKLTKNKIKRVLQEKIKEFDRKRNVEKIAERLNSKEEEYIFSNTDKTILTWVEKSL